MIDVVNLTQHYGIKPVLRDVTLDVRAGELVAVMGPNGMGKTTLLAAIAGVLSPQRGYVEINGRRRRSSVEAEQSIRAMTAYLPAEFWLPDFQTCRDFALAVGKLYSVPIDRLITHIEELMALFQLTPQIDAPISRLSTGQRKKMAIVSLLVTDAPVLIIDEPFSGGIDPEGLYVLKEILRHRKRRRDGAILIAMPVPELVEEVADRIALLHEGEITAFDTAEGLRQSAGTASLTDAIHRFAGSDVDERLKRYLG